MARVLVAGVRRGESACTRGGDVSTAEKNGSTHLGPAAEEGCKLLYIGVICQ